MESESAGFAIAVSCAEEILAMDMLFILVTWMSLRETTL